MGLKSKFRNVVYNMKIRTKIALVFTFLVLLLSSIITNWNYNISSELILSNVSNNIYEIAKKNNELADLKLMSVVNRIEHFNTDPDVFKAYSSAFDNPIESINSLKLIDKVCNTSFSEFAYIKSVHVISEDYSRVNNGIYISYNEFAASPISNEQNKDGRLWWEPTYNLNDLVGKVGGSQYNRSNELLFSVVRKLNLSTVIDGSIVAMGSHELNSYLLINFSLDFYDQIYNGSVDVEESIYYVVTNEGEIVYNNTSHDSNVVDQSWFENAIINQNGIYVDNTRGSTDLICYTTSNVTGWISAIVVPMDSLLADLVHIRLLYFLIALFLSVISIFIVYFMSYKITKPIAVLLKSINLMKKGNFNMKINVVQNDEIGILTRTFNDLNNDLQKLIVENYEVRLNEQEAQIMALNLQFNPHFLYNTLNVINLMAIDRDQKEISKMIVSLSSILQYSLDNLRVQKVFSHDIEWLDKYIYIMSMRFIDKFTVYYDIEPEVYNCITPKFFLQPLLENAILHGLEDVQYGGIIRIKGWIEDEILYFSVEDNGKGISEEKITQILDGSTGRIGCYNVDKQIKLLFGEKYGLSIISSPGKGARMLVCLPKKTV